MCLKVNGIGSGGMEGGRLLLNMFLNGSNRAQLSPAIFYGPISDVVQWMPVEITEIIKLMGREISSLKLLGSKYKTPSTDRFHVCDFFFFWRLRNFPGLRDTIFFCPSVNAASSCRTEGGAWRRIQGREGGRQERELLCERLGRASSAGKLSRRGISVRLYQSCRWSYRLFWWGHRSSQISGGTAVWPIAGRSISYLSPATGAIRLAPWLPIFFYLLRVSVILVVVDW